MSTLRIVTGSTRPERRGGAIAEWVTEVALTQSDWTVESTDLRELGLPLMDEPEHPILRRYRHSHTKAWSALVDASDALVFVVPEYNHGYNAATKNAIDYLHSEWTDKSIGFVSYGGISGGTRAVQALRQVFLALKAVPVLESVNIAGVDRLFDANNRFASPAGLDAAAAAMFTEIDRREQALALLRA